MHFEKLTELVNKDELSICPELVPIQTYLTKVLPRAEYMQMDMNVHEECNVQTVIDLTQKYALFHADKEPFDTDMVRYI